MEMVIDIFAHYATKKTVSLLKTKPGFRGSSAGFGKNSADPDVRLGLMDKYGIDIQALTQTTPAISGLSPEDATEICRICNDDNYALCKAYPARFVNICMVSLVDMASAMKEIDRSLNELDCRGVTISTNQEGKGLDSPEYFPFYEKLVEHDLPVLLHPVNWESYPLVDMKARWRMMHIFGWPFDTTQAVWSLIFGGVLDRFPSLKIVTHHMGGMIPYYSRRIEVQFKRLLTAKLPRDVTAYWGNIYGDTAVDGTRAAYPCGYAFFGSDRLLFGTDYPAGLEEGEDYIRENLAGVKSMDIPQEDMDKILGGNARKMFKIG
jgi:predicted TIM-barrel fold metal-dependent hydrolase